MHIRYTNPDVRDVTGDAGRAGRSFDAVDYVGYVFERWRFVAIAVGVAALLALGVSLAMPPRYTSTARLLIETPAASDPRTLTAVSPVYLESLKGYELFASSDQLFVRALDRFHLRGPGSAPVDDLKQRILKVTKLRDTKILEIRVTLEDPKQAQAMAQYVAEETARLSATVNRDSAQDLINDAAEQVENARSLLEKARAAAADFNARAPVDPLQDEIDSLVRLHHRSTADLLDAEADAAERAAQPGSDGARERDPLRARADTLRKQVREIEQSLATKNRLLSQRQSRRDILEAEARRAQGTFDSASARLRDIRASAPFTGERLKMIDVGIVSDKPSSPQKLLNTVVAAALGLVGSLIYLSVAYSARR